MLMLKLLIYFQFLIVILTLSSVGPSRVDSDEGSDQDFFLFNISRGELSDTVRNDDHWPSLIGTSLAAGLLVCKNSSWHIEVFNLLLIYDTLAAGVVNTCCFELIYLNLTIFKNLVATFCNIVTMDDICFTISQATFL